jgi:hypothetical protein
MIRRKIFAGRGVDVVHGQIAGLSHRAKYDCGKVGLLAIAVRPADELNDFRAHKNPSHIAIATRPTNASDIKYAVMPAFLARVRPQIQPTGLSGASVIARRDLSAVAQRAKAEATKQSSLRDTIPDCFAEPVIGRSRRADPLARNDGINCADAG